MATKARRSSGKKKRSATRGGSKPTAKRGAAKKKGASKKSVGRKRPTARRNQSTKGSQPKKASRSPIARAQRVAREVIEQATVAVNAGMETLKDLGGDLAERVRSGTPTTS